MKAFYKAVRPGNLRKVKSLTDRIKLALCRDQNGSTPLHNAVLFAQQKIIAYLVRSYPQALNALDHVQVTDLQTMVEIFKHIIISTTFAVLLRLSSNELQAADSIGDILTYPKVFRRGRMIGDLIIQNLPTASKGRLHQFGGGLSSSYENRKIESKEDDDVILFDERDVPEKVKALRIALLYSNRFSPLSPEDDRDTQVVAPEGTGMVNSKFDSIISAVNRPWQLNSMWASKYF